MDVSSCFILINEQRYTSKKRFPKGLQPVFAQWVDIFGPQALIMRSPKTSKLATVLFTHPSCMWKKAVVACRHVFVQRCTLLHVKCEKTSLYISIYIYYIHIYMIDVYITYIIFVYHPLYIDINYKYIITFCCLWFREMMSPAIILFERRARGTYISSSPGMQN